MTSKLHFLARVWGYFRCFRYFRYFRCFLIVQDGCLSGKTLLLRCEGLICAYSIAQMFYYANTLVGLPTLKIASFVYNIFKWRPVHTHFALGSSTVKARARSGDRHDHRGGSPRYSQPRRGVWKKRGRVVNFLL